MGGVDDITIEVAPLIARIVVSQVLPFFVGMAVRATSPRIAARLFLSGRLESASSSTRPRSALVDRPATEGSHDAAWVVQTVTGQAAERLLEALSFLKEDPGAWGIDDSPTSGASLAINVDPYSFAAHASARSRWLTELFLAELLRPFGAPDKDAVRYMTGAATARVWLSQDWLDRVTPLTWPAL